MISSFESYNCLFSIAISADLWSW